jgi:repressor LexA
VECAGASGKSRLPLRARQQGLPLLGCITAGPLAEVLQGADTFVQGLEDVLPYKTGDFLLTVQGDSMIGDGIHNGDRVLVRPNIQLHNGEIAAVHVGEEYCATLKHVHFEQSGKVVKLRASNPAYADIRVPAAEVRIVGVYRGLIRAAK